MAFNFRCCDYIWMYGGIFISIVGIWASKLFNSFFYSRDFNFFFLRGRGVSDVFRGLGIWPYCNLDISDTKPVDSNIVSQPESITVSVLTPPINTGITFIFFLEVAVVNTPVLSRPSYSLSQTTFLLSFSWHTGWRARCPCHWWRTLLLLYVLLSTFPWDLCPARHFFSICTSFKMCRSSTASAYFTSRWADWISSIQWVSASRRHEVAPSGHRSLFNVKRLITNCAMVSPSSWTSSQSSLWLMKVVLGRTIF